MLLRKLHLVNFREKFLKSALIEAAVTITSKSLTSSLSNQYPFQYFMKSQRLQNKSTPHFQSIIMAILVSRCQIVKWDFFAVKWYLQRLDFELKKQSLLLVLDFILSIIQQNSLGTFQDVIFYHLKIQDVDFFSIKGMIF